MTTTTTVDSGAARAAAEGVADPELPAVTLGMLGVVERVEVVADGEVEVDLLPTFAGCPATEMMQRDVTAAVGALSGVSGVRVRVVYDPPWSTDRITDEGREALERFGIAPPGAWSSVGAEGGDDLALGWTNPVAQAPSARHLLPVAPSRPAATCPYCGSTDTTEDSPFGPTPCRAVHHCAACRQPFEAFKPL